MPLVLGPLAVVMADENTDSAGGSKRVPLDMGQGEGELSKDIVTFKAFVASVATSIQLF